MSLLGAPHAEKNSAVTLSGFVKLRSFTQGSSFLATLGFVTESLWDSSFLETLDFVTKSHWDFVSHPRLIRVLDPKLSALVYVK